MNAASLDVDWSVVARRNSRSVQTLIGWIFWDPGAVSRYEQLGLTGPLGYIAARGYPFSGAGREALSAAFGSITPVAINLVFDRLGDQRGFEPFWHARNAAVHDGLAAHAPDVRRDLTEWGPHLWTVVQDLDRVARPLFASHLEIERSLDPLIDAWHAVNCLREWRGDSHWAVVATHELSAGEASILHNAWLRYDDDWISLSRGNSKESIDNAWDLLTQKGLAFDRHVNSDGLQLRQRIEDQTDLAASQIWRRLGVERSREFATVFEPACEALLARVDESAGINYQPASRVRAPWVF